MTDDIIAAIETQLNVLAPTATIYRYYCPQNFKTPSFLISIIDQDYGRLLRGTYTGKLSFDVQYFSGTKLIDIKATRADCISMQETLLKGMDLVGRFRCINKDARITDNVLHFTFDIKYSERAVVTDPQMNSVTNSTKEK
ncbi:hypothetical protein FL966_00910 [Caproiciproducens galactitolivorans]|uniref:Uncharacterized protein n=1 Tax=Caproiciproducens galactitolivorans TaxID=642589 RepID=A0A4Z0Y7I5_9FIRM|nr:hypothetical protein [Caproiciproducens galactitolivorans]QEY33732.1 hypothetical protein FL966_00910 [Caproiciproducens galactitolivorans]TGJ75485.1 hypothetical protein CAGA_23640 [Caproiciproducens galactitolivorans]